MSSEIHLAFAHPKERSEASESEPVYDRISLRDHIVEVEIGAFQSERGSKQRVCSVSYTHLTLPTNREV